VTIGRTVIGQSDDFPNLTPTIEYFETEASGTRGGYFDSDSNQPVGNSLSLACSPLRQRVGVVVLAVLVVAHLLSSCGFHRFLPSSEAC
jgi:hypothetical protein